MRQPIPAQGRWLKQVVTGFFAYHAVPTNARALGAFRYQVIHLWRRTLRRRSQKDGMTWERTRQRPTLAEPSRRASDLRMVGYYFLVMATWSLCGIFGIVTYALQPQVMPDRGL